MIKKFFRDPQLTTAGDAPVDATAQPAAASPQRLQDLLVKTSRTFALAIPLLPEPTRNEVSVAYLLFRIADTFEDASVLWSRSQQVAALGEFAGLLESGSAGEIVTATRGWLSDPPTDHRGYLELLAETPTVIGAFRDLSPGAHEAILEHTRRTALGMVGFVSRRGDDGRLVLQDTRDLRAYCYVVAGIVGEMLTELFVLQRPRLLSIAEELRQRSAAFGEGLQLVNILKDSAGDLEEGRSFLPADTDRSEIFGLARGDLDRAAEYVNLVQDAGGPEGIVRFTGLPVLLARASLDRVETSGPGSKLTRPEVFAIQRRLDRDIARGRRAVPLGDSLP